jgi:hypothetical protein
MRPGFSGFLLLVLLLILSGLADLAKWLFSFFCKLFTNDDSTFE